MRPVEPATHPASRTLPRIDRKLVAAIFFGGALGTATRAALAEAFPGPATAWPWPALAANVAASLVLGVGAAALGSLRGAML